MEGRAASDDEEDDRGPKLEVKKHVSRLHSCGKGLASFQDSHSPSPPPGQLSLFSFPRCQNHVVHQLPAQNYYDNRRCCSCKGQKQERPGGSKVFEKEKVGEIVFYLFQQIINWTLPSSLPVLWEAKKGLLSWILQTLRPQLRHQLAESHLVWIICSCLPEAWGRQGQDATRREGQDTIVSAGGETRRCPHSAAAAAQQGLHAHSLLTGCWTAPSSVQLDMRMLRFCLYIYSTIKFQSCP